MRVQASRAGRAGSTKGSGGKRRSASAGRFGGMRKREWRAQRKQFLVTGIGGAADEPYRLRSGLEQSRSERMGRKSRKADLPTHHATMTLPGPSTRDASPGPQSAATRTGSAFIRAPLRGWQRAGEGTSDTNRTRKRLSRERNGSELKTSAHRRG